MITEPKTGVRTIGTLRENVFFLYPSLYLGKKLTCSYRSRTILFTLIITAHCYYARAAIPLLFGLLHTREKEERKDKRPACPNHLINFIR